MLDVHGWDLDSVCLVSTALGTPHAGDPLQRGELPQAAIEQIALGGVLR